MFELDVKQPNREGTFNHIVVIGGNRGYVIKVPANATSALREGDRVRVGQTLLSFTYAPEDRATKTWQFNMQNAYEDADHIFGTLDRIAATTRPIVTSFGPARRFPQQRRVLPVVRGRSRPARPA